MSTADRQQFDDDEPDCIGRMLFFKRPRCRDCGSSRLLSQHSQYNPGDDSVTRQVKCAGCGRNWELVLE